MTEESGHTLVEITTAMVLAGLVLTLAYIVYSQIEQHTVSWTNRTTIEDDMHVLVDRVSTDFSKSNTSILTAHQWLMEFPNGSRAVYVRSDGSILRNGMAILRADSIRARLNPCLPASGRRLYCLTISSWNGQSVSVTRSTSFYSRNESTWPILRGVTVPSRVIENGARFNE